MAMSFDDLWDFAPAVLGWAIVEHRDHPDSDELVQLRGAYERPGLLGKRSVVLMRSDSGGTWAEILSMTSANVMVTTEVLRSDLEEIDALTEGSKVSVVLGEDQVLQWQTNGAHAGIILDRIAASELDPDPDLLRCLRGTPSSSERLVSIDLEAVTARAGSGRVPTEEERQARLRPVLLREEIRIRAFQALEEGDTDRGMELVGEMQRMIEENMEKRRDEFGERA